MALSMSCCSYRGTPASMAPSVCRAAGESARWYPCASARIGLMISVPHAKAVPSQSRVLDFKVDCSMVLSPRSGLRGGAFLPQLPIDAQKRGSAAHGPRPQGTSNPDPPGLDQG